MCKKIVNKVLIGQVGVDSGQLMICDPCYIDSQWIPEEESSDDKRAKNEFSYNGCCETNGNNENQLNYKMGHVGAGITFSNFGGDGMYNVYAVMDNNRNIKRVVIELDTYGFFNSLTNK